MVDQQVKSPRIFGRLSIFFGIIIGYQNLDNLIKVNNPVLAGNSDVPQKILEAGYEIAHIYKPVFIVMLLFSLVLVIIGFGQVFYKRWVEQWSKMWSMSALLTLVIKSVYLFIYARIPQSIQFNYVMKSILGVDNVYSPLVTGIVIILGELMFFAPYPVVMLVFFNKTRVISSLKN